MSTKNPRLNVVLDPILYFTLGQLAQKQGVSLSLMARDLLKEAIELHEDRYWQKEAQKRDKTISQGKTLTHKQIWK